MHCLFRWLWLAFFTLCCAPTPRSFSRGVAFFFFCVCGRSERGGWGAALISLPHPKHPTQKPSSGAQREFLCEKNTRWKPKKNWKNSISIFKAGLHSPTAKHLPARKGTESRRLDRRDNRVSFLQKIVVLKYIGDSLFPLPKVSQDKKNSSRGQIHNLKKGL